LTGQTITWTERRLVSRSHQLAQAGECALHARLAKALAGLAHLNERWRGKHRLSQLAALREAAEAILVRYQVQGLVLVSYEEQVRQRPIRRYGSRPATIRMKREVRVMTRVDQKAVDAAVCQLGWRVCATMQPADQLPLPQVVLAYRSEYLIERDMGRLKGQPLSLTPMYVERDDHATGLVRLLSVALRVLTLLEFVVHRHLAVTGATLAGLYAGNRKRATAHPTAERVLESFQELTLTIVREGRWRRYHLRPLSPLQRRILSLLDFPAVNYAQLCAHSHKPP
jgi:transposase